MPDPISRPSSSSRLFLLPSELRHRIWEYYLSFTHADFAESLKLMPVLLRGIDGAMSAAPHRAPLPSLMLASRSAYRELAPLVHTTAAMRIHSVPRPGTRDGRRVCFAAHGNLSLERLRRLVLVVDMDCPYWNAWLDLFVAVLGRTRSSLEHLTVDWAPIGAPATAFSYSLNQDGECEVRYDDKMEDEFLDLLVGSAGLQSLRFYGWIPEHWAETIQQGTSVAVKCYPYRWWREPGMD